MLPYDRAMRSDYSCTAQEVVHGALATTMKLKMALMDIWEKSHLAMQSCESKLVRQRCQAPASPPQMGA